MTPLVRVTRGVWRPAEAVADLQGVCAAVLDSMPRFTVLSGRTAAQLHGLWLPARENDPIELVLRRESAAPRTYAHSTRSQVTARRRGLTHDEVCVIDGLPVTSLARTWIDLAETLELSDLVAAGDSAQRSGLTTEQIDEAIHRAVGRRGVARARSARRLLDARSRSRPESHLRVGLAIRGLPTPQVNVAVHDEHGQWLAEPDLSFKDVRLAIEYNGAFHAGPQRMRRDITRAVDLGSRGGWRTETVGPVEVFRRMDQTAAWIRDVIAERSDRNHSRVAN